MSPLLFLLLVAFLAVVMSMACMAADSALLATSRSSLDRAFEDDSEKIRERIVRFHDDDHTTFAVLTLGRTLADAVGAVAVTAYFFETLEGTWLPLVLSMAVTGIVWFIAASASPRTLGRRYPYATLRRLSWLIATVRVILALPARFLIHISNAFTPGGKVDGGPFATQAELRHLVDRASEGQALEADERNMIQGVFELGDTTIRELMVPRTDMVTIDASATANQAMRLFVRSGFSRVPVIGDGVDDLLGMLYFKDVMRAIHSPWNPGADRPVTEIMRPARFYPEFLAADTVMTDMRTSRVHVGIPVDEYGGVSGIITIEDILEEIVGEIADEHDRREDSVEAVGEGQFRVPARLGIDEVGELFRMEVEDDDVDTIGGLLAKALGRVPILGAEAESHGLAMSADRTSGRRKQVSHILVSRAQRTDTDTDYTTEKDPA